MLRCKRCDVHVEDDERAAHAASEAHRSNGGSAEFDDEDFEEDDPGTRGMSKTR